MAGLATVLGRLSPRPASSLLPPAVQCTISGASAALVPLDLASAPDPHSCTPQFTSHRSVSNAGPCTLTQNLPCLSVGTCVLLPVGGTVLVYINTLGPFVETRDEILNFKY